MQAEQWKTLKSLLNFLGHHRSKGENGRAPGPSTATSAPQDTASRQTQESCLLNNAPQTSSYLMRYIGSGHLPQSSPLVLIPSIL